MDFIYITFLSYKIRYTVIDGIDMYLVSDLLDQYNEREDTNYMFETYLEDEETREFLIKKFHLPQNYEPDKWDIDKSIKYITYIRVDGTEGQDYVICEELLMNCLMRFNPLFASKVYKFFKNNIEEEVNSDLDWAFRLSREVKKFQKMLIYLRDNYAPDLDIDLSTDTLVL